VTTIHLLLVTVMVIGAFSLSHHLNLQLQQALFEETSRLEYLASHDSLTGLHNRRSFEAMLDELAKPGQLRPFALMLMDINRFKAINDSNGHQVGDQVLQEFASKLKQSVREFDFVARVGGDEFAVILNNLNDHTETKGIIALIAERLQQNILVNGRTLAARASIGVALWPGTAGNAHDVYSKADEAMYASKRQGREYIIYDDYEPSPRRAQLTY
jgi:diguanylate cyclase (GGDEF)-like protein